MSAINPPAYINWKEEEFFSDHPGGVNILMCDGSVHFLSDDTHYNVYYALCTRNGEEVLADGTLNADSPISAWPSPAVVAMARLLSPFLRVCTRG